MELIIGAQNDSSSISDEHSEMSPSTSQLHVLAVDDSVVDRKIIEKLLKNSSYKVTTVDSGRGALELLGLGDEHNIVNEKNELKVNMIITGYCMPGMTGYELLKTIKQSELKEIPMVIMSSEKEPSRISRCMDEGAEDFILKPVRMSDVKRLKALQGKVLPVKHTESVNK